MSVAPTFSIVIPVYNRAKLVRRAIESCLRQRHPSFEIIVVDDGSTDDTVACVSRMVDPRLRLCVQPINRGVSPARNLGVEHARGEWIVCLDSDDELTSDALNEIEAHIRTLSNEIDGCRFMCRLDDGSLSPEPALHGDVWDYEGFVRWSEKVCLRGPEKSLLQETTMCVRRRTFETVKFPDGQALEVLYNMDFAARFHTATSPAIVRLYHTDSPDQLTRPAVVRMLDTAPDHVRSLEALLERHSAALARWAPGLLIQYTRGLATQQFLAGDRMAALRTLARLIQARGGVLSTCAVLVLGLLGRRTLATAKARRMRRASPVLATTASKVK